MEKAKAAVSNFLSKDGKHETTVHETVNPSIQNERVLRTQHENVQQVVDREVHQDHYHTSVQPIKDKEVLPERHTHNMAGVEQREFQHGNDDHIKQRLEAERGQFKSTRELGDVQQTSSEAGVVAGEHVHHHVHETIQPVIQKETIQPSVVHTTIPVHEVHHNEAKHHAVSALPTVNMAEFKSQGGALGGREVRSDAFAGEPKSVGDTLGAKGSHHLGGPGAAGTTTLTNEIDSSGRHTGHGLGSRGDNLDGVSGTRGTRGDNLDGVSGTRGDNIDGVSGTRGIRGDNLDGVSGTRGDNIDGVSGTRGTRGDNLDGVSGTRGTATTETRGKTGLTGSNYNDNTTGNTTTSTTTGKKASLMDRINPNVDSNGDGKAGFMK